MNFATKLAIAATLTVGVAVGARFIAPAQAQTTERYTDNGNGTVSDNVTGLMWQQQDDAIDRTWQAALAYCEGLSLAGFSDWRLPNVKELGSIVDDSGYVPAIDATVFPSTASGSYWSSSVYAPSTDGAWDVSFDFGFIDGNNKTNFSYTRCVR